MIETYPVTTVLLAGGRGVRIGGNKGLQQLLGKPLYRWVLDVVSKQSDAILISANEQTEAYQQSGYAVLADILPDWQGPLAGLHAGMHNASTEFIMTVPCDTPFLPPDLLSRMMQGIAGYDAAVAMAGGRRQPAITLYRRSLLPELEAFIGSGSRKVNDWLNTLRLAEVNFENSEKFNNINTLVDLENAAAYVLGAKKV